MALCWPIGPPIDRCRRSFSFIVSQFVCHAACSHPPRRSSFLHCAVYCSVHRSTFWLHRTLPSSSSTGTLSSRRLSCQTCCSRSSSLRTPACSAPTMPDSSCRSCTSRGVPWCSLRSKLLRASRAAKRRWFALCAPKALRDAAAAASAECATIQLRSCE